MSSTVTLGLGGVLAKVLGKKWQAKALFCCCCSCCCSLETFKNCSYSRQIKEKSFKASQLSLLYNTITPCNPIPPCFLAQVLSDVSKQKCIFVLIFCSPGLRVNLRGKPGHPFIKLYTVSNIKNVHRLLCWGHCPYNNDNDNSSVHV